MKTTRQQQDATRRQIVASAVDLMTRQGFDGTTMKDIARAAGIGDATIYKYFPTKDRIVLGYVDEAVRGGGDGAEQDVAYHRAIAVAAQNPFLISTLDYLRQFLRGVTRVTRANEARRHDFARQVHAEHEAIAQAIEAGDAARARRAATRHMDNAIARIQQADPAFWQQEGDRLASALTAAAGSGPTS